MARHFLSNCRCVNAFALLLALAGSCGCATNPGGDAGFEHWRSDTPGAAAPYLFVLREYLGQPAGAQAAYRDRLRVAAERGGKVAALEYAFALSVDRDDRASLEKARAHFEKLLAGPDPMPVALDALVRLQLGQVIDRLERMRASGDIHEAYRAAARDQQMCFAQLRDTETKLEDMRAQLSEVRRKLDALARIEQTVNQSQETQDLQRDPADENSPAEKEQGNDDRPTTDTPG